MTTRVLCKAMAAIALLTAPAQAFIAAPLSAVNSPRNGHELHPRFISSPPLLSQRCLAVCVLLFNPRTENEGIYTLQLRVREGYINTVVLFEQQEDAERYAGLLEAQDFPAPQVEALDPREIAAFTEDAGYKTSFIPAGTLFLPPEDNVDPSDRPWRPDGSHPDQALRQVLADADDSDEVDYNLERARLESLFGGTA